jgi:hypothetical protein
MSNEGIFPSGDPSIMEVMADHWLVLKPGTIVYEMHHGVWCSAARAEVCLVREVLPEASGVVGEKAVAHCKA